MVPQEEGFWLEGIGTLPLSPWHNPLDTVCASGAAVLRSAINVCWCPVCADVDWLLLAGGAVFFASTVSLLVLTAHALLRKCLSGWYTRWSQWLAVGECKVEMYVK